MKAIAKVVAVTTLGLFAAGAFAADRLNANNNRVDQTNSGARGQQSVKIGFLKNPGMFASAQVNANNNRVTQHNSGARGKQDVEIGIYK